MRVRAYTCSNGACVFNKMFVFYAQKLYKIVNLGYGTVNTSTRKRDVFKHTGVFDRMMKHSAWTKLRRKNSTKSAKHKKQVHWAKQLEEIHVYYPEPEGVFFTEMDNSVSETQADLKLKHTATTASVNATFELQQKLEKLSLGNKVAPPFPKEHWSAWQNVIEVENNFLQEDWV